MCGTRNDYKRGCRCDDCRAAVRAYRRAQRGNVELTVESDIPCMVVRQLHDDAHLPFKAIASSAGVTTRTVLAIYHRQQQHTRTVTADALYALQAEVELKYPKLAAKWSLDAELAER